MNRSEADQQLVDIHGSDFLEALARGLRVLTTFNGERGSLTLSELAQATDLSRATVRRVLYTLESLGFVASEGRQFRLTPRVLTLASAYLTSNGISGILQPSVTRISNEVNESCSAAVLDGADAVMIARAAPLRIVSVGLQLGYRLPAYCSAVGRVLLSDLSDDALATMFEGIEPKAFTPETLLDRKAIVKRIVAVRKEGFSLVDQEMEEGFRSIAVPVRDRSGVLVCALHIGVPADRAPINRLVTEFLPLLQREARDVSTLFV